MKSLFGILLYLVIHFGMLSLLAFGGANTIIPEIHRQAVVVNHWITETEFADLFAISQAAPGPNTLIVTLVGWQAAGILGAAVATVATCIPAALLTMVAFTLWDRFRDTQWRQSIQAGLTPVTVGMVAASAFLLTKATDHTAAEFVITGITALVVYSTKLDPLWCLSVAGVMGLSGVLN